MNHSFLMANRRLAAFEAFRQLRFSARIGALAGWLLRRRQTLANFTEKQARLDPNRKYLGVQDIKVRQITGSTGRSGDFDASFRPLKEHLAGRWVSLYLRQVNGGWDPIRVYKVGCEYYVVDGHHRVSVARHTGWAYITAEVWEYRLKETRDQPAYPREIGWKIGMGQAVRARAAGRGKMQPRRTPGLAARMVGRAQAGRRPCGEHI